MLHGGMFVGFHELRLRHQVSGWNWASFLLFLTGDRFNSEGANLMHEIHEIEDELREEAEHLSEKYHGAPVVVIVGGYKGLTVPRCMTGTSLHAGYRLRDLVGMLETAKQIETLKHFRIGAFGKRMKEKKGDDRNNQA